MKFAILLRFGAVLASLVSLAIAQTYQTSTLAGLAGAAGNTDGSGATARFHSPGAMSIDGAGNLYVADQSGSTLRKITPAGVTTTLTTALGYVTGIAVDGAGTVYLAESSNVICRLTGDGALAVIAGTAGIGGSANGTGPAARFNSPSALAIDAAGALYVCDSGNYTIRKISPAGVVTTLAGLAGVSGTADGPGSLARFVNLQGIVVDATGYLFVVDRGSNTVRKITPAGEVSTLAGTSNSYYDGNGDGTGSAAHFNYPTGLALDSAGTLYVTESNYHTVRRVSAAGVVTTVLGLRSVAGIADATGTDARFYGPTGIAVNAAGDLFVSDTGNHTLRRATYIPSPTILTPPAAVTANAGQTATFTISDAGGPTATYQWQRQAAGSGTFVNLVNTGAYSGATTATLSVAGLTAVMNADQFRCVVSNSAGTMFSSPAALTVTAAPVFTSPSVATFHSGVAGAFAFTAAGAPLATFSVTSGALPSWASLGSASGLLTGTPANSTGSPFVFTVTATNAYGTATQVFTLSVPATIAPPTAALSSGRRHVLFKGQSRTLTASGSGAGSLTYQWKRNGLPIAGATAASYEIINASAADAGYYQLAVSNEGGIALSPAMFVSLAYPSTEVLGWGASLTLPSGLTDITAVAAGYYHGLALRTNGTVVAWGSDSTLTTVPAGLSEVVALAASANHSLALKSDGTVVAWGSNSYGQATVPAGLTDVVAISAGYYHSMALKSDGTVVEWGTGYSYAVTGYAMPAGISGVVAITAGDAVSFAIRADGSVAQWGYYSSSVGPVPVAAVPVRQIALYGQVAVALRRDGGVVAWSASDSYGITTVPANLGSVMTVAASYYQGIALRTDGSMVTWGASGSSLPPANLRSVFALSGGSQYRVVARDSSNDTAPTITVHPASVVANLGQGATFSATAAAGTASFGYQWYKDGVLITGATNATYTVSGVTTASVGSYFVTASNALGTAVSTSANLGLSAAPVVSVSTGGRYPLAAGQSLTLTLASSISSTATVQWRRNGQPIAGATGRSYAITNATAAQAGYYQAVYNEGSGPILSAAIFVPVAPGATQMLSYAAAGAESALPAGFTDIAAFSARNSTVVGLTAAGTVVRSLITPDSGSYYGDYSFVPAGLNNVVAVAAGYNFSLALRADGTVVVWGSSSSAALGALAAPAALSGVVGISAGNSHALALKGNGTVVAWGSGAAGATSVPAGLANVVAVSAGDNFSLALRADGTVVGWGRNSSGESSPPTGLSGVVAIAAGNNVSLALRFDGTVVAWGSTNYGQTTVPAGLSGVTKIAVGDGHSLAVKADGTVAVWGTAGYSSSTPASLPASLRNVVGVGGGNTGTSIVLRDATGDTAPVIVTQPQDATALTGQTAVFRVAAITGTAPLSYLWRRSGATIAGATDATLALANVTEASSGSYDVIVSNYLGRVTSRAFNLAVSAVPAVALSPAGRTALASGGTLTLTGATALAGPVTYQWRRNGRPIAGATSATYTVTSARWADGGAYQFVASNAVGPAISTPVYVSVGGPFVIRAWGDNGSGQTNVPGGLTGAVAVSAGYSHSLALKNDGTVVTWGNSAGGLAIVPSGLTNVVAISAGYNFSLALRADGTVASWGTINYVPVGLADVIAISASLGSSYAMALKSDGTVVVWTNEGERTDTPTGLGDVVAIHSSTNYRYVLRRDGSVVFWSQAYYYGGTAAALVTGPTGVVALSSFSDYLYTVKTDGTVGIWSGSSSSPASTISGLSGAATVSAGYSFAYVLKTDGTVVAVSNNYSSSYTEAAASVSPSLQISTGYGHALALRDPSGDTAPVITAQSGATTYAGNDPTVLSVSVTAVPAPIYQWYRNGQALYSATNATYTLGSSTSVIAGTYTVTIANAVGSVISADIVVTAVGAVTERSLLRGTARANPQTGVFQSSFTVEGSASKTLLIRGVGPTLATFGVTDPLADPSLTLTNANGTTLLSNDNWGNYNSSAITSATYYAGAYALPNDSKDAALLRTFSPGTYHVRLSGPTGTGGVALLEVYDTDTNSHLVYLSTHALAGSGNDVFVQGFSLAPVPVGRTYLIRALGPTLGGVGALADPRLTVVSTDGATLAANDDWAGDTVLAALGASVGAMPLAADSKDAAVNFTPPSAGGTYTVKISGPIGTTGRVLLEIFEIDAQRAATTPVAIVAAPQPVTVVTGQPATFGAVSVGKPAPTYQWRKNGSALTGATAATLTLASTQASDAGDYSVVATNANGTATSSAAALVLVNQAGTHAVIGPGYVAGSTLTVTNTLTYTGTAAGLGWEVVLPAGWTYAAGGVGEGDVKPVVGATGTLGWNWTNPPASPVTFTYVLNIPAGETAPRALTATAQVRAGATPTPVTATPASLLVAPAAALHCADTNQDLRLSLTELTRVIELYNTRNGTARTGAYAVATATTEDGFVADPARASGIIAPLTLFHSADTNRDGAIGVFELTRVIELYNVRNGSTRTGQYHPQGSTEDGFAPGP